MKNLKPTEQVAYQEGYADAQKKRKDDFLYGFYTGIVASIITVFICLTFNLYM
jgi:hypothetical protein